jgi:signal transduction histidine kinase
LQVAFFQAARELLHNVVKHSRARAVNMTLSRDVDQIRLTLQDDGVGFSVGEPGSSLSTSGGFGLFSIRERFEYLGGKMEIESAQGAGTRVTLSAPLTTR